MYLIETFYKVLYNQLKKQGAPAVPFTCMMSSLSLCFAAISFIMYIDIVTGSSFSFFLKDFNKPMAFFFIILLSFCIYFLYFKILNFKKNGDMPIGLFYITRTEKRIVWTIFITNILLFFMLATILNNKYT